MVLRAIHPFVRAHRFLADSIIFGFHPLAAPAQKAVQCLLNGPRDATFRFTDGARVGMLFSCLTSHRYFFVRDDYERRMVKPMSGLVRPGSVAFDVGAHFGFWALMLSRLCGDTGKVFAFEPSPTNRVRLENNLAINSVRNVEVVPLALSDRTGTATMSDAGSMSSIGTGDLKIETTTLDEFCRCHPVPDFMLVDVEGFAAQVFQGATATYRQRFVPTICELHTRDEQAAFLQFMQGRARQIQKLDKLFRLPNRTLAI